MARRVCAVFIAAENMRVLVLANASRIAISFRPFLNSFLPAVLSPDYFFASSAACVCARECRPSFIFTIFLLPTVAVSHFEEALISIVKQTHSAYVVSVGHGVNRYTDTQAVNHSLISCWLSFCVSVVVVVVGISRWMWGPRMRAQKIFVLALLGNS